VPTPKLDVDIKQLITWNFLVQLGLTAVSWAVVFFTSHAGLAAVRGQGGRVEQGDVDVRRKRRQGVRQQ
jgi:hypothetical protein